jgi:hypothetical protein
MRRQSLDPGAVLTLITAGWTVMYGPALISFQYDDRLILRFDDGHVDVEDRSDPLRAPTLTDPVWSSALAALGIDTELLMFNSMVHGWSCPLAMAC